MPSKKSKEPTIEVQTNDLADTKPRRKLTALEREFTIWENPKKPKEGNPLLFFFRLDKDGKPIKLGDGTYGVVYEVLEKGADERKPGKRFAVKLLYSARANVHNISTVPPDDLDDKYSPLFQGKPSYEELILRLQKPDYDKNTVLELFKTLGEATPKFAKDRFEQEIKATTTIRNARPSQFYRVVDIKGGTESFRNSNAYKNLSTEFSSGGFTVSDYALVMELYNYTLKDLLENGKTGHYQLQIPEKGNPFEQFLSEETQTTLERQIKSRPEELLQEIAGALVKTDEKIKNELLGKAKDLIGPLSGYDLLKRLDFNERIRSILPIILDIARGVETIHFARKRHRDLKPANVYLQVSEDKHSLQADIGDLGFIDTDVHVGGSKAEFNVSEVLAFGTYHYRSPEQKDYFDVCEVAVHNDEKGNTSLIIKDPKFRNTIIEKGDFVIFSKDDNKTRYTIHNDPFWGNGQHDAVTIQLKAPQTVTEFPPEDEKTQVFFFKSQQVRTDMFGLGALIYDLVTAGESPERFYDEIRSFDKASGSVENLMGHYEQLYEFEPPDQSFVNIFRPFRHPDRREYVPTELVKIILKCMLYKVKDSYYGQLGDTAITLALTDLRSMEKDPYLTKEGNINPLLGGNFNITPTLSRDKRLDKTISELQQQHFIKRIPNAYTYLFQLYKRIEDSVTDNKSKAFFIQLLPESISNEERRLAYENVIQYANEQDYHADLLANGVSKISRNIMNPFVPDYLKFMQRRVKITSCEKDSIYYRVSFQDTAWTGDMIKVGDWIRIEKETGIQLFKVASIKDDFVALEQEVLNEARKEKQNKDGDKVLDSGNLTIEETLDGLFIQSLHPAKYYSHVLGIYLYQMFFVGISETPKSTLPLIYTLKGYYPLTNDSLLITIGDASLGQGPVDDVLSLLSNIYLKLILTEYSGSYWKEANGEILKMIVNIRKDLRKLADLIAENLYENFTPDITLGLIELQEGVDESATPSFSPSRVLIDQIKLKPVADLKDVFGFWQRQYMLAVSVRGMGKVLPKPKVAYFESEMVTLTAEADDGWHFAKWELDDQQLSGEVNPVQNSVSFPMYGNRSITAVFVSDQAILQEKKFVLKTQLEGDQGGMIRVEPEQVQYDWGKRVYLTAKEHEGFEFVGWKSDGLIGGIEPSISFLMQEDVTVTAVFRKRKCHLFIQSEGGGTVDPEPKGTGFEYEYGTQVVLKAIQKETQFLGWEKDGVPYSNELNLDFPIKDNMSLVARFVKDEKYILSIEVVGDGFGKVTRAIEGPAYKPGTQVNIKAVAGSKGWGLGSYTFMGWSGDYQGTNPSPVIEMTKNMHLIARFD